MPKRKLEEAIIVNPNESLHKCYDCIHWHRNDEKKKHGAVDFSSGSCDNNGYSKCPPLFTCNGWASGNGTTYDNIHKNI